MSSQLFRKSAIAGAVFAMILSAMTITIALGGEKGQFGVMLDGNKITSVLPGSGAAKAGLKAGDVIVELNGKKIESHEHVSEALADKCVDDKVKVKYKRGDETNETTVTMGKRQQSPMPGGMSRINKPRHYTRKEEPLNRDKSLKAGLKWIASQQEENGSFAPSMEFGKTMRFRISITSLAGMALMTDPEFKEQVEKTLKFILECSHEDGYVYFDYPSFKGMWEHGFATQFLAEALMQKKKAGENTEELEKKLRKAVELIKLAQNLEGGWGYRAVPDPHAEVGPGAAMLDALLLAKRAGIAVGEDIIKKGLKSQCALMLPPGKATFQGEWRSFTYEANAFVLASLLGWKDRPEVSVYLEALEEVDPADYFRSYTEQTPMRGAYWTSGYHTLGLYYTAVSCRRMGEEYKGKFEKWHESVCENLAKFQNEAGTWKGWFGDVYGTAFVCLTIAANEDKLENYRAANEFATEKKLVEPENPKKITLAGEWNMKFDCKLEKAETRHDWQGFEATVKNVGLKEGANTVSRIQLQGLFPEILLGQGSAWSVSEEFVSRFFATFHPSARGVMQAEVIGISGDIFEIKLRALVKFGENSANHIQTTSMEGILKVDVGSGKVLSLSLETISGCIRVRSGQGGYVSLNDITFKVSGDNEKTQGK